MLLTLLYIVLIVLLLCVHLSDLRLNFAGHLGLIEFVLRLFMNGNFLSLRRRLVLLMLLLRHLIALFLGFTARTVAFVVMLVVVMMVPFLVARLVLNLRDDTLFEAGR